jgi:hypothetical protein
VQEKATLSIGGNTTTDNLGGESLGSAAVVRKSKV